MLRSPIPSAIPRDGFPILRSVGALARVAAVVVGVCSVVALLVAPGDGTVHDRRPFGGARVLAHEMGELA